MIKNLREILFILIILFIIITSSLFINKYIEASSLRFTKELYKVSYLLSKSNWTSSLSNSQKIEMDWKHECKIWALFTNHHEIDQISISLEELSEYIKYKDNTMSEATLSKTIYLFSHIPQIEKIYLENII